MNAKKAKVVELSIEQQLVNAKTTITLQAGIIEELRTECVACTRARNKLEAELEACRTSKQHVVLAYRKREAALRSSKPAATGSALQRCKELSAQGVKCYVQSGVVYDSATRQPLEG